MPMAMKVAVAIVETAEKLAETAAMPAETVAVMAETVAVMAETAAVMAETAAMPAETVVIQVTMVGTWPEITVNPVAKMAARLVVKIILPSNPLMAKPASKLNPLTELQEHLMQLEILPVKNPMVNGK